MGREGSDSENLAPSITPTNQKSNGQILLEVIDESLHELFSPRAREALYDHLERNYAIGRDDIPKHLDQFSSVLRKNFGRSGRTIERRIEKKYCEKTGKEFHDGADYLLSDYVESNPKSPGTEPTSIRTTVTLTSPVKVNDGIVSNWSTSTLSNQANYHSDCSTGTAINLNSPFSQDYWAKYYSPPQGKTGMCA